MGEVRAPSVELAAGIPTDTDDEPGPDALVLIWEIPADTASEVCIATDW